jgi:hypothetical protein
MTKLEWEKENSTQLLRRRGGEHVSLLEMPPTIAEIGIEVVPRSKARQLEEFLKSVALAKIRGEAAPSVPASLRTHMQRHIDRQGGVFEFANWLPEFSWIRKREQLKLDKEQNRRRVKLLRQVARAQASGRQLSVAEFPAEFAAELQASGSLQSWAASRSEYGGILKNAQNYVRHLEKRAKRQNV